MRDKGNGLSPRNSIVDDLERTSLLMTDSGFRQRPIYRKNSPYGRIVFGASAVLFGVIALMWHDPETWQNLQEIWALPWGAMIGGGLMIAQVAGGIGIQFPRTVHLASTVLGIVYLLFSLSCVPGIVGAPKVEAQYGSFFEQFCLFSGALALFAATEQNNASAIRCAGMTRLGLGLSAISFTMGQVFYFRLTAELVPKWIPLSQSFWAVLTTVAFGLVAIAVLIDRRAQLAAGLMTCMVLLFGVLVWVPRLIAHPQNHENWSEFCLTFLIAGASWMVADL
jgi:hypothetical protein